VPTSPSASPCRQRHFRDAEHDLRHARGNRLGRVIGEAIDHRRRVGPASVTRDGTDQP